MRERNFQRNKEFRARRDVAVKSRSSNVAVTSDEKRMLIVIGESTN